MKFFALFTAAAALGSLTFSQDSAAPEGETAETLVAPSSDLWQAVNVDGKPAPARTWTLSDDGEVMRCTGGPTGFLASRAYYRTMDLEFEWRWPEQAGNSGLLLFTETLGFGSLPGRIGEWPRNLEVQLKSGDAGQFVMLGPGVELDVIDPATGEVHAGDRIAGIFRKRAVDSPEKPLGEWNKMRVEVGVDEIVVYVNDVEVNRGVGGSLTAGDPGGFHAGPFAFQSEGAPIEFRNVKVEGEPASSARALLPTNQAADGTIQGWTPVFRKPEEAAKKSFASVHDGILSVAGRPGGYLQMNDGLGSRYQLSLEWAWVKGYAGNSGVLLHVTKPDVLFGWPQSLEVQLQSESAGDFWVIGDDVVDLSVPNMETRRAVKREGDLHSHRRIKRLPLEVSPENEPGRWNRMEIDVVDDAVRVYVNGQLVNAATGLTVRAGAIALQSEGAPVRFRNLFVR
ncbi:MAG: DUF1080 domain-containing protein [Planctomycetota bacterium]